MRLKKLCVVCCLLVLPVLGQAAPPVLTGDTNRPSMSLFVPGETVELRFHATGLAADAKGLVLDLDIVDEAERPYRKLKLAVTPAADGSWSGAATIPAERFGFFRVYAKLSNGVELAPMNTRPGGFLSYGVVVDPAKRKLYPSRETFFGMQGGFSRKVQVLPYLGIRWVLGHGSWGRAEPDYPGQFAEKAAAAEAKGEAFPSDPFAWCRYTVDGQSQVWTTYLINNGFGSCCVPTKWKAEIPTPFLKERMGRCVLSPAGEKDFANYCQAFAKAFAKTYAERDEHIYEITWEPSIFNPGTLRDIVRFYELAYPVIHAEDPKAVVIGPTLTGDADLTQTGQMLALGLGRYIDAWSLHYTFGSRKPEQTNSVARIRRLKMMLREATGHEVPLFNTENGNATAGTVDDELQSAQESVRSQLIELGEGFRAQMSFYIADFSRPKDGAKRTDDYGYFYNLNERIPFGSDHTSPKPVAPAYAAMSYLLEGHRSAGAIEWLGDTALGYAYEDYAAPHEVILALWDYGDAPREISLPVGVTEAEVFDWMGNGTRLATDHGSLKLTLGNSPVYVRGVAPRLWGREAVKPLQLTRDSLALYPGATAIVEGAVVAQQGEAIDGQLTLITGATIRCAEAIQSIKLAAGETAHFAFAIEVPADAPLGGYPLSLSLRQGDVTVAATGCMVKVQEAVRMKGIKPTLAEDGQKALALSLEDAQGEGASGTIEVHLEGIPESTRRVPFRLAPGQSSIVTVPLSDLADSPRKLYTAAATVTLASGYTTRASGKVNFLAIAHMRKPPVIDGKLDEWSAIPAIELSGLACCGRSPQYYSGDAATARYAWDAQALYLAVEVADNAQFQSQVGETIWMGDSLQCGFNLDPFRETAVSSDANVVAASRPRYVQVALTLTGEGTEAWCHGSYHRELRATGALTATELPLVVVRDEASKHTIYEAAVPWSTLGAEEPPAVGSHISVDMSVNDRDTAEQKDPSALYLFNGINNPDIHNFGLLYLAP